MKRDCFKLERGWVNINCQVRRILFWFGFGPLQNLGLGLVEFSFRKIKLYFGMLSTSCPGLTAMLGRNLCQDHFGPSRPYTGSPWRWAFSHSQPRVPPVEAAGHSGQDHGECRDVIRCTSVAVKLQQERAGLLSATWVCVKSLSFAWLFATPRTVARQAPLSRGFPRQEYWSGLPFLSPGDFPYPGIEPASAESLALADEFFTTHATWEALATCKLKLIILYYRK